jgi:hypothetical protein
MSKLDISSVKGRVAGYTQLSHKNALLRLPLASAHAPQPQHSSSHKSNNEWERNIFHNLKSSSVSFHCACSVAEQAEQALLGVIFTAVPFGVSL